ncbi:MAG: ABC transporter ATP-binding protein [Lachnospiraceae bacterium]|nr:ABC transporter ATP-binding protein [Lachnospiraceae bacterium]
MRKILRKYWLFAILAPLFMAGEVTMDLLQPRMMSKIVDEGVLGLSNQNVGDLQLVITIGLQMIGLLVIGVICGVLSGIFANMCSQNFGNDVRKGAFAKIMKLPFEQMDQFSTGSLITRVTNDITQIQNLVSQCIRGFVRTFLLFAGGIGCMLMLDLSFAVVVACALPLILFCVIYFILKANPKFSVLQEKLDRLNNVMQENVSGLRVVKAYTKEEYEQERFEKANGELVNTQLDVLLLFSYMTPIMNVILNVSVVAVIWIGGIEVKSASVTPGDVMAAVTYISQILNAVMRMTMIFQTVSRGVASGKRVREILHCEPAIADGEFDGETAVKGKVEFRDVSFAYPGMGEEKILEHFSLTIEQGETIAIMGATGCGKSTLIHLIPRFFDVTEGQVLVDGVDVKQYKMEDLRNRIAIALQNSEIFHMTIGENLAWGNPAADKATLEHAAETAQAMEFIQTKQKGMDTEVNQAGTSLSGGQKQRLSIGRAVLKGAEILIFDDATSALDLKTEAKLYEALKKDYPHTTKIIIAQRIASVKDADRIVVMENGRLADCGSHEELLKNSKIYQDIYDSQMKNGGETDGF